MVLKCSKEVFSFVTTKIRGITIADGNRKGGPDIESIPHRNSIGAENLEVQTMW